MFYLVVALRPQAASYDCDYHPGGCQISRGPPIGWKCTCKYTGGWTCSGTAVHCDNGQSLVRLG